jgi:hypothetical protein
MQHVPLNANAEPYDPAWATVKTLVDGGADPGRLLELCYWCQERGLIELIRAYLQLPEHARRMLGDYLLTVRPREIEARSDAPGRLVLSHSRMATKAHTNGLGSRQQENA